MVLIALLAAPKNILELCHWIHDHAEFFDEHFGFKRLPSQATLYRFLACVDVKAVETVFTTWVTACVDPGAHDHTPDIASVDGKWLKGTGRTRAARAPWLTCGVYLHRHGLPAVCALTPDHNEVGAAKRAVPVLVHLGVALLVADAGYTGHRFARTLHDAHIAYLLPLKNNQQQALEWARFACAYPCHDTARQHGRRSAQTWCWTLEVTRTVPTDLVRGFHGVQALLKLIRHVTPDHGVARTEVAYALTSSSWSAARLLQAWRGHWGIENRVHWVRDTVFGEDRCRARQAGPLLAVLRSMVLVIAQRCEQPVLRFTRRFNAQPQHICAALGWLPLA